MTIPKLLALIEEQTGGMMKAEHFTGGNATNPYCTFQANYLRREDGSLSPLAHGESRRGGASEQARKYVEQQWRRREDRKLLLQRKRTGNTELLLRGEYRTDAAGHFFADEFLVKRHNNTFAVSGMLFQDAYNLDLARLRAVISWRQTAATGWCPFAPII